MLQTIIYTSHCCSTFSDVRNTITMTSWISIIFETPSPFLPPNSSSRCLLFSLLRNDSLHNLLRPSLPIVSHLAREPTPKNGAPPPRLFLEQILVPFLLRRLFVNIWPFRSVTPLYHLQIFLTMCRALCS